MLILLYHKHRIHAKPKVLLIIWLLFYTLVNENELLEVKDKIKLGYHFNGPLLKAMVQRLVI